MSKKLLLSLGLLLGTASVFAQTIVETTPQNRKVVLEEFTGINCVFCPDGHTIANGLAADNPGDFFIVNIHSGGFAAPGAGQPDFRTPFGQAIDGQSGLTGYPAGTINRQNFPGQEQGANGSTALSRGQWASATADVLAEDSYLNIAVEADIDVQTNQMTILVEGFYTGDSPEATNFLNVAITQDNTTGPQTGGNMGDNYVHNHRLIDLVTGQFGEEITTTTNGTFVSRTYVYDIISDVNGVSVEIGELDVVAYMTETTQYVISGNGAAPTYSNFTASNDANLRSIAELPQTCETEITPTVNVQNLGSDDLSNFDITYSVNGGAESTFSFTGTIASLASENIELPAITYTPQAVNTIDVSVSDDENNGNNDLSATFDAAPETAGTVVLTVSTDTWAEEVSWTFRDSNGTVLASDSYTGNNAGTAGGDDNTTFTYNIDLPADCITFTMVDAFGDGVTITPGAGVSLFDKNGVEIYAFNADYGSGFSRQFNSDGILGIEDTILDGVSIYPNPSVDIMNIVGAEGADVEIYSVLGKRVSTIKKIKQQQKVDVSMLAPGAYFVKITSGNAVSTQKVLIAE